MIYSYLIVSFHALSRVPQDSQILAQIELVDFVSEGEPEALLLMRPEERGAKYDYEHIERVAAKLHREGNAYVEKQEWKLAAKK